MSRALQRILRNAVHTLEHVIIIVQFGDCVIFMAATLSFDFSPQRLSFEHDLTHVQMLDENSTVTFDVTSQSTVRTVHKVLGNISSQTMLTLSDSTE